ncbi:helix-turn-helix domain-containing protein [Psychroflexus montanilacus]|uniref:helix-turn-helix domain-containing protein n=1 Tax=Psychroflexus montanilacus TaxID=2873598 RepID=UPI001CCE21FA|nr:AraC family transcriptional regulator [Psychroflexus montanilacus]MBZ9650906.1 AraC family transcriptional regulator [Psychroflexus montanilacus]
MKLYLKFDIYSISNKIIEDTFLELGLKYKILDLGEIELLQKVTPQQFKDLNQALNKYGIEVVENPKVVLVQKIKDAIKELIFNEDSSLNIKSSVYLSEKLSHSYGYLSKIFTDETHSCVEQYTIIQKTEYAKHHILNTELNLSEIAFKLNYSSLAHLSSQFKSVTGLTPTAFQRIILKRKNDA